MGWDWDYVLWNVDLPRLKSLNLYWKNNPPVHQLVAAYMEYKPKSESPKLLTPPTMGGAAGVSTAASELTGLPERSFPKPVAKRYQ